MKDGEPIVLQGSCPAMEDRRGALHRSQPLQSIMVCQDLEVRSYQEGTEHLHTPDNGQTLLLSGAVIGFCIVQCPGGTADYSFLTFLFLGQYGSQTYVGSVCIQPEGPTKVRIGRDRTRGDFSLENLESVLALLCPFPDLILTKQGIQGGRLVRKFLYKSPIIAH